MIKITVVTEEEKQELLAAIEHIHYADIDTDIPMVNQKDNKMDQGKLRSLMFHAGFCNEDGGWDNRPIFEQEHDNFRRFAELIVRQMLEVTDAHTEVFQTDRDKALIEHVKQSVKQHFGVDS